MPNRRELLYAGGSLVAATVLATSAAAEVATESVEVDLRSDIGKLEPIWKRCVGSDRAEMTLRESWRRDARRGRQELGLERVRFHGIFDDELGAAPKRSFGAASGGANFQDVDAVYDGLLELGLQPYVEMSFMPGALASGARTFFGYNGNITPPKSFEEWQGFVRQFGRHLIDRYGAAQVRQWPFEVWNEPNLAGFWSGTQSDYFELYRATAIALKSVDPALRVGGPSTSAVQWIPEFLAFCAQNELPVDFVSTHIYAGDNQARIFGAADKYSANDVIPAAMAQVRAQIDATKFKGAELWLSEWSSDSPAMIAHVITQCLPYCHAMSYWQISGDFEEILVPSYILKEGDNGWGLMSKRGIVRPTFNTFKLMNRLGERRLHATGPALAATRTGGAAAVLVWNLAAVPQPAGIPGATNERRVTGAAKRYRVKLAGAKPGQTVKVSYVDEARGSPYPMWRALGSPKYPNQDQLARIRAAAELAPPEHRRLSPAGELMLELPPEGVALIELAGHAA